MGVTSSSLRTSVADSMGEGQNMVALRAAEADDLRWAHATLLEAGLACTLDRRPRLAAQTEAIAAARAAITGAVARQGLDFDPASA